MGFEISCNIWAPLFYASDWLYTVMVIKDNAQQKTIAFLSINAACEEMEKSVAVQILRFKTQLKVHVVVMKPSKAAVQVR